MHPRKLTLHLTLLLRLKLPMELRVIIIEDYFPFLPRSLYHTPNRFLQIVDERIVCSFRNCLDVDCMHSVHPIIYIDDEGTKVTFKIDGNVTWRTSGNYYCKDLCCDRQKYIRDCNVKFEIHYAAYVMHIEEIKNNSQLCERNIIYWYRNTVLSSYVLI